MWKSRNACSGRSTVADAPAGRQPQVIPAPNHMKKKRSGKGPAAIDDQAEADWMNEENASFLLSAIFSGKLCRPTPFAEIAQDVPAVWRCALRVFEGNKKAARNWLETRSPIFQGRRPIAVAMQIGGRRRVLRELKKLLESRHEI